MFKVKRFGGNPTQIQLSTDITLDNYDLDE